MILRELFRKRSIGDLADVKKGDPSLALRVMG